MLIRRPLACLISCVGLSVEPSDKTLHLLLPELGLEALPALGRSEATPWTLTERPPRATALQVPNSNMIVFYHSEQCIRDKSALLA